MAKKRQTPRPQDRARVQRTVSLRIKDIRRSGVSQREIADRLGVNVSTVRRWENQERTANRRSREAIYRLWRRTPKRLGAPGARVDLTGYFKRVWFDGRINTPLNFRPVPSYDFPDSAPVVVTWRVMAEWIDAGGSSGDEVTVNVNVGPGADLAGAVEDSFTAWVSKAQRSFTQLLKATMEAVVLRWLKM